MTQAPIVNRSLISVISSRKGEKTGEIGIKGEEGKK